MNIKSNNIRDTIIGKVRIDSVITNKNGLEIEVTLINDKKVKALGFSEEEIKLNIKEGLVENVVGGKLKKNDVFKIVVKH